MPYLLNLVYLLLLTLALPALLYRAIRYRKYRQGWANRLLGRVPRRRGEGPGIWLHAVSVGEVNQLQPLLVQLERDHPQWECVISTTTRTGYELARQKYAPREVFYCPLDFSWAVRAAVHRVRPSVLVLVELELWPNLVLAARRAGARVVVVNGRLSARSARGYARLGGWMRSLLRLLDVIAVQNDEYAARFQGLGANPRQLHVTGSLKFDGAITDRQNATTRQLAALAGLGPQDQVFLAGSTQHPEEAAALQAFRELKPTHPGLKLILVPRHPERFEEVARMLERSGLPWARRSAFGQLGEKPAARPDILLVDAVGELGSWWGTALVGFVGGSWGSRGGQNMIEPAAYGVAVCFGPKTQNFRDVVALLLAREAAVVVEDPAQLTDFVRRCLDQPDYATQLGRRASQLVCEQQGATRRTAELIESLVLHQQDDAANQ